MGRAIGGMKVQLVLLLCLATAAVMASDRESLGGSSDSTGELGSDSSNFDFPLYDPNEEDIAKDTSDRWLEAAYDKLTVDCEASIKKLHDRSAFGLVRFTSIASQVETKQMSSKIDDYFTSHADPAAFGYPCDTEVPEKLAMFRSDVWPTSCSGVVHKKDIDITGPVDDRPPFFDRVLIISDHAANPIKSVMELEFLFKASGYEYRAYSNPPTPTQTERRPGQKKFAWPPRCTRPGTGHGKVTHRSFSIIVDVEPVEVLKNIYMLNAIVQADHIIVVQSTDFDLGNVVAGVTNKPVVTYPTSEGAWVSEGGRGGLNAMLDYCNAGVAVVNIDNSIGAWSWAVAGANFRRNAVLPRQLCIQKKDTCHCGVEVSREVSRLGGRSFMIPAKQKLIGRLKRRLDKLKDDRRKMTTMLKLKLDHEDGTAPLDRKILDRGVQEDERQMKEDIEALDMQVEEAERNLKENEEELEALVNPKTCTDRRVLAEFIQSRKFVTGICAVQEAMDAEFMERYQGRDPNLSAHQDFYDENVALLLKNRLFQASGYSNDGIPRSGVSWMTSAFGKTDVQLTSAMMHNDYSPNIGPEQAGAVLSCYYSKCFDNNGRREVMTCSQQQINREKKEAKKRSTYESNKNMLNDMLNMCPRYLSDSGTTREDAVESILGPEPVPFERQCPTSITTALLYDPVAKLLYRRDVTNDVDPKKNVNYFSGRACVVSAGIADQGVVRSIIKIFNLNGVSVDIEEDLGVNSIAKDTLRVMRLQSECDIFIATAGMEGTLPEVVAQIANGAPVISVPSNVGYGAHQEGMATLGAMSTYPTPGMVVTNIDAATSAVTVALSLMNTHYFKRDQYFATERAKNEDDRSCDLCVMVKRENYANDEAFKEACANMDGCSYCSGGPFGEKKKCISNNRVHIGRYCTDPGKGKVSPYHRYFDVLKDVIHK